MKVLIADDHVIVRECIKALLSQEKNISIVGEASNGKTLLELYEKIRPDVVLTDISMPEVDGWEAIVELKRRFNFSKVIVLSMSSDTRSVATIMEAGAAGYLSKDCSRDELIQAINFVHSGDKYISPNVSLQILNNSPLSDKEHTRLQSSKELGISKRELEVLKLVVEGLTNNEIADRLFNSKRTIESHRRSLIEKTGSRNTADLVKFAYTNHILRMEHQQ
jgi:DNA-binding NarL/FixJ family response regulator